MQLVVLLAVSYCLLYIIIIHCKCNDQYKHVRLDTCVQWLQSCQFLIHVGVVRSVVTIQGVVTIPEVVTIQGTLTIQGVVTIPGTVSIEGNTP